MHRSLAKLVFALGASCAVLALLSLSYRIHKMSAYSIVEPHAVATVWEAASRGEYWARCANGFASGMAPCTSLTTLVDSLVVRLVAAAFGRSVHAGDPELVDPVLQLALSWWHGIEIFLLFLLALFPLKKIFPAFSWAGAAWLLFLLAPVWREYFFTSGVEGLMGAAIWLLFLLLWRQLLVGDFRSSLPAVLAGYLCSIKAPLIPFSLLTIRSKRALFIFSITALVFMAGLFRSSYDLTSYFRNSFFASGVTSSGSFNLRQLSGIDAFLLNARTVAAHFWLLAPFALFAWGSTVWRKSRKDVLYWALCSVLILFALKARNSDERFFVGFEGIFISLGMYGLYLSLHFFLSMRKISSEKKEVLVSLAGTFLMLFISIFYFPGISADGLKRAIAPRYELLQNEKALLSLLETEKGRIYIDRRLRFHLGKEPLAAFADRILPAELLDGKFALPQHSTLITLCYDPADAAHYGLESFGALGGAISAQCPKEAIRSRFYVFAPHNQRATVATWFDRLVVYRGPLALSGSSALEKPLVLHAAAFAVSGDYNQNYESEISNPEGQAPFALEKTLAFSPGAYSLRGEVLSTYRNERSTLALFADGKSAGSCSLGTGKNFSAGYLWAKWRSNFFPVNCVFHFSREKRGAARLRLEVRSEESRGQARFTVLELSRD